MAILADRLLTELVVIRADREWGLWQWGLSGGPLPVPTEAVTVLSWCRPRISHQLTQTSLPSMQLLFVSQDMHPAQPGQLGGWVLRSMERVTLTLEVTLGLGKLSSCPGGAKTSLMLAFCGHMAPHLCL